MVSLWFKERSQNKILRNYLCLCFCSELKFENAQSDYRVRFGFEMLHVGSYQSGSVCFLDGSR